MTAFELDLPDEVIRDVVMQQFKTVRQVITNVEYPQIMFHHFGTMWTSPNAIDHRVRQIIEALRKNPDYEHAEYLKSLITVLRKNKPQIHAYQKQRAKPQRGKHLKVGSRPPRD